MPRTALFARLVAFGLSGFTAIQPAMALEPPVCHGENLIERLRAADPASAERISSKAEATLNAKSILWKVDKSGVAPSYLLGTAHLTDPRITKLPAETQKLLDQASAVAVEVTDLTPASMAVTMLKLKDLVFVTPATRFDTELTDAEKSLYIHALAEAGLPEAAAFAMQPWLTATMLALAPCETARAKAGLQPLDMQIEQSAKFRHVPVVGLETAEEQFRAMAGLSHEAQIANLKLTLKFYPDVANFGETLVQLYQARRIAEVFPLMEEMTGDKAMLKLVLADFQKRLITDRNVRMRDRMQPLLDKGGAFVAVGALHLIDRDGLVELLKTAGYKLTPVN